MGKTSRQRILEFIASRETTTSEEISHALHMGAANARYHLGGLEDEGLVQVIGELPGKGRGRPRQIYTLRQNTARHNLEALAAALLETAAGTGEEQRHLLLPRLAEILAGAEPPPPGSLSQRLYQGIRRLNQMNYHARWEARAGAPRLILGHCPYAGLPAQHGELCQMDAYLLERLLDAPVQQTARLEPSAPGLRQCVFIIH